MRSKRLRILSPVVLVVVLVVAFATALPVAGYVLGRFHDDNPVAQVGAATPDERYPVMISTGGKRGIPRTGFTGSGDLPKDFFATPYAIAPASPLPEQWKIVAVGDIMAHEPLQLTAYLHRHDPGETSAGYDWIVRGAKSAIATADLAIGNLETPISPSVPRSGFPRFNADPSYLAALRKIGFDLLFTANNHMLDHGLRGIDETRSELESNGFLHLGTGPAGASGPEHLTTEIGTDSKLTVGFLNYSLGLNVISRFLPEYLLEGGNTNLALLDGQDRPKPRILRSLARLGLTDDIYTDRSVFLDAARRNIKAARDDGAEVVIVFLHWGPDYRIQPSKAARQLALDLFLADADIVIGAGPHVIQPIERIYTKDGQEAPGDTPGDTPGAREHFVAYSLGNFVSAQRGLSRFGLALEMTLGRDARGVRLLDAKPRFLESVLGEGELPVGDRIRSIATFRLREVGLQALLDYLSD